ncbi:hypothetical protein G6F70_007929 [Rhizopus microsporus]|uniref:EGF-like domain-containing protein n=1 Tax=Rhizopus azygosporus TaxID=86630 RepID=A0A367JUI6_RHIAZ|nr:hypothetical protein G6F70_007929 [Rhizopus microsporus]KAG1207780.1 hypothetical protein G6F69_007768 [Rhizopus microsporus]KAG1226825.1 hypothetical protein G6F67_008792 [Rhizopus microsporus]RCH93555.1 hypothetical protein CU097_012804 [Rhizopus azygosporus]
MKAASLTTIVASLFTGVALARSPVYLLSKDITVAPSAEQISFDTFSMYYSHIMDASSSQRAVVVQDNEWLSFDSNSGLFEKKLDANLVVLVSSVHSPQALLPTKEASFYVDDNDINEYSTLANDVVNDILKNNQDVALTTFKSSRICVKHSDAGKHCVCGEDDDDKSEYFKLFFSNFKTGLFDETKKADAKFMNEVESIRQHWDQTEFPSVNLIEINSLKELAADYGVDSDQYKEAERIFSHLFEKLIIPNFENAYPQKSLAAFIFTPIQTINKRGLDDNDDVCYRTARACRNGTSGCHGHGECVKTGESCFTCQCVSSYTGDACQYVDAVGDFQLLFWTSVLLIVTTASVITCVFKSGSNSDAGIIMTQSLPKQE